jgi:hypothetical protein
MKATPKAQHWLAVLMLVLVSGAFGFLAFHEHRPTDTQVHLATSALRDGDSGLFASDAIYGESGKWRMDSPFVIGAMKLALVPTGMDDPILPFRIMTGGLALVYLIGMYLLLFQQVRNWSVAALMSVISAAATDLIPGLPWGFGALETTEPALVCIALLPLILLTYLRYEKRWQVVWVFGFIGLLANIHLSTAINILAVLWPVYLFRGRFSGRTLLLGTLGLLAAAVASLPYVAYLLALRMNMPTAGADTSYKAAIAALRLAGSEWFYPDLLNRLLEWRFLAGMVILGVPAVLVLGRWERYRVQNRSLWAGLIVMSLAVSMLVHPACQLIAKSSTVSPAAFTFFDAIRLMLLPLVVLLAQALTNVFRMARYRQVPRIVVLVLLLAWVMPSPNFRPARHAGLQAIIRLMPVEERPAAVKHYGDRTRRRMELDAIGVYLRENSDLSAVVLSDNIRLRMLSRRSAVICRSDLIYDYVLTPQDLKEWVKQMRTQLAVLYPPGGQDDGEMLRDYVRDLRRQERFAHVNEWYVLVDYPVEVQPGAFLERIELPGHWRFYKLYRIVGID